jgi:hypothetical protein
MTGVDGIMIMEHLQPSPQHSTLNSQANKLHTNCKLEDYLLKIDLQIEQGYQSLLRCWLSSWGRVCRLFQEGICKQLLIVWCGVSS